MSFRGSRPLIAILGRCNSGKSSLLNFICGQKVALVSSSPGTTGDPVDKPFELLPLGPVTFYDTAGLDEASELGRLREQAAREIMQKADMALLVSGELGLGVLEKQAARQLKAQKTPFIIIFNKIDRQAPRDEDLAWCASQDIAWHALSAAHDSDPSPLRQLILQLAPEHLWRPPPLVSDLLPSEPLVACVTPIDSGAPGGRLIAPQVQVIRELLEIGAQTLILQPGQLASGLRRLKNPPDLVISDSQALTQVKQILPEDIELTTFSLLFARQKGGFAAMLKGAAAIEQLPPNSRVLLAEACSHHSQKEDIGRIKLPAWLQQYTGHKLNFSFCAGQDFPPDLAVYSLVLHCGGCMLTRKAMGLRLAACSRQSVPITNYGMAIAQCHGLLARISRLLGAVILE